MVSEANRLAIGPGIHIRPGWLSLEADHDKGGDFMATIPPFPEAVKAVAWDEMEWIHGITSVYPWEAEEILAEIHTCLIPGGKLTLEQPDFDKSIVKLQWLFGDDALRDPLHMNKWGWTPESLTAALLKAGFRGIVVLPAQHHIPARDFRVEAFA